MPDDEEGATWVVRVKNHFDEILTEAIKQDTHSTKSEFIRQAVREKLERMGINLNL